MKHKHIMGGGQDDFVPKSKCSIDPLTAAAIGGALGGLLSGDKGAQETKTGILAAPKEVQDAILKIFLPALLAQFEAPRRNIPLTRAVDPATDPFASRALFELQQFSDLQPGGLFGNLPLTEEQKAAAKEEAEEDELAQSQATSSQLAQQFLGQVATGIGGGSGIPISGAGGGLLAQAAGGQLDLGALGQQLGGLGFGQTRFAPTQGLLELLQQGFGGVATT